MSKFTVPGLNIERLIARGGMAEVYVAEQQSLGRKVAVKVMDPTGGDEEFTQRFFQEAKLLAGLNHSNIITIYDFGKLADGRFYLTMEYLPGGDLEQRLKNTQLSEKDATRIVRELARALNFFHKQGIVHRDIKPANILFRNDGSLVLTDFGIAKENQRQDVNMTQSGMTMGSPAYSSPEQAQGHPLDQTTDIYSVGVVLLEMLVGSNPYRSDTNINTAIKHIQMPIPRLKGNQARFQPLLEKMLAKNPRNRFQTAMDILNTLDAVAGHTGKRYVDSAVSNAKQGEIESEGTLPSLAQYVDDSLSLMDGLLKTFHEDVTTAIDHRLEVSRSNVEQWQLMAVLRELRKQRTSLDESFKLAIQASFENFSNGKYSKDNTRGSEAIDMNNLSLVQHDDLEKNIAASNLIKRVSEAHKEQLMPLHARLCHVAKHILEEEACPVGPTQLAYGFKKAIAPLELEQKMNQLLFKILEKCLLKQAGEIYKTLNQLLVATGVLPELTFAQLMKQQHANRFPAGVDVNQSESYPAAEDIDDYGEINSLGGQTNQASVQSHNETTYQTSSGGPMPAWKQTDPIAPNRNSSPEEYQQQLFGAIRQMQYRAVQSAPGDAMFAMNDSGLQVAVAPQSFTSGDWVPAGNTGINPSVMPMAQGPVYSRRDIVTALHGLQGNVALADDPDKTGVIKAFKDMRPGNLQPCPVQALDTVIDAIMEVSPDDGDEPKQLDEDDCSTIDLVGMIFEYMLKDEGIPDSAKAMLSYLHVPYIKVALLDPEMFAKPDHPARLLLDRLSEAGTLWLNKEGHGQFRVFDEIKRIVNQILSEFDAGVDLFEKLLSEFDEFVAKVKRRVEQLEKLSAQKAEAEQHLQKVKAYVHKRIKTRVSTERLPAPLVAMLLYPWFDYLTSVMLRHGEKSEEWNQGLQVVDILVWSIKPKTTEHEVHRLNNVREHLQKQIQLGFDTIGFDQIKGQELLSQILQLQDQSIAENAIEVVITEADKQEIERITQDTTVREKVVMAPKPSEMTEAEKQIIEKLKVIEFGTWFEFKEKEDPGTSQKLKVAWYNTENLSYLMVNSAGKQVSMLSALELARLMIAQTAIIIAGSAKPFFERALEAIYEQMTHSTGQTGMAPAVTISA